MRKVTLSIIVGLFMLTTAKINAQQLPAPSPMGKVEQIIGVTTINLEYSRPSVKGRIVFGGLVPYNEIWRLGANACTKLETSSDIMIDEKALPKGKYALFAIPSENGDWVIIINSDATLQGAFGYDKSKDAIRINIKPMVNSFTETLTIDFDRITPSSAVISIKWDQLRVDIPFSMDTKKFVNENIEKAVKKGEEEKELDKVYSRIAFSYYNVGDYENAIIYADKSLKIKTTSFSLFTKARSLQGQGKTDKAIKLAQQALESIQKTDQKGLPLFIENNIKAWSNTN